jgi:hypothetical protein
MRGPNKGAKRDSTQRQRVIILALSGQENQENVDELGI